MSYSSFFDRIVAIVYWPALLLGWGIAVAAPIVAIPNIDPPWPSHALWFIAGFDALLFFGILFDGEGRRAMDRGSELLRAHWKTTPWPQRLFPPVGDRRLQYCSLLLCLELTVLNVIQHGHAVLLAGVGLFMTILMQLATLKRFV